MTSRLALLASGLGELGCRALVVFAPSASDPDLSAFLSGPVHLGMSLLVLPAGGEPRLAYLTPMEREEAAATGLALLSPEELGMTELAGELLEPEVLLARIAERALEGCGVEPGRVALAGSGPAGMLLGFSSALGQAGWALVPGSSLVNTARKRKRAEEMEGLRRSAAATCTAFRRVAAILAQATIGAGGDLWSEGERLTVGRLRAEAARTFAELGLEQPKGNIIAPAEEGAVPHSAGRDERVLRAGESLVVDLYPRGRLFADCTRTFCVGPPSEPLAAAHALVRQALEQAYAGARPGMRGWSLQEEVCRLFGDAGYATPISHPGTLVGYVHNLGHGVGFDLHELPTFKKASGAEGVLREGDVFTLEPGLYSDEERYGVRLEDLVYLGPAGLENLTPLPYDLDPRAWVSAEGGL
jgi:Xaa-Pro aminopeptidase